MPITSLELEIVSQERLFPEHRAAEPVNTPLSVIDASVLTFSPTGAFWIYNPPSSSQDSYSIPQLLSSFRKTLNFYSQWTGQLKWSPYNPKNGHSSRYRRLELAWGYENDPGVEVVVARSPIAISSAVPEHSERIKRAWDTEEFASNELFPSSKLAFWNGTEFEGLTGLLVQLTVFACGGLAIGVKLAHVLADAQSMISFVRNWASINQSVTNNTPNPALSPLFDPSLLDYSATGKIDAEKRNPSILATAQSVPRTRYDYWAPTAKAPSWAQKAMETPSDIDVKTIEPAGTPPPWEFQDQKLQAKKMLVQFTKDEILAIHMAARTPAPYNSSSSPPITQHTSLLAHIWLTLLQTRNIDITVSKPAYLAVSLSLRPRVSPRLPPSFIGSPITHAAPRLPPPGRSPTNLVAAALAISSALAAFTPEKVAALLHEAAFVSSPQRYWDAFLGERNLIATSWVRAGMYDIDFFGEKGLRYAEPFMPGIDGIAVLLEAGGKACGIKVGDGKGHWADNGVDAMICARADVLNRMLERSDSLRRFRV